MRNLYIRHLRLDLLRELTVLTVVLLVHQTSQAQTYTIPFQALTSSSRVQTLSGSQYNLYGSFVQGNVVYGGFIAGARLYIIPQEDLTKPVIIFNPASFNLTKGNSQNLVAQITDDFNVQSGTLFYRPIGSGDFVPKELVRAGTTSSFSVSAEPTWFDDMGLEYYIGAIDPSNNSARVPVEQDRYYYSYVKDPLATVPPGRLSFGKGRENYRMISMPYQIGNNTVVSLFGDELEKEDHTKWRMFTLGGNGEWAEYPAAFSTLERGKGYWIIIKEAVELKLGEATAPAYNRSNLFQITLQPGWNQIGNPYTVPISWDNVRSFPSNAAFQLKKIKLFKEEGWTDGDVFLPFEGGLVYLNDSSPATIKIPFINQVSGGRLNNEPFSSDISSASWELVLTVRQGNIVNSLAGIGMHPDALPGNDFFDEINPPRFMDFAEVSFAHPEHPAKAFCKDIVPLAEKETWNFSVETSNGELGSLTWDNTEMGDNNVELYLEDLSTSRLINMRKTDRHGFSVRGSSRFRIHYGRDVLKDIASEDFFLGRVYPNPFGLGTDELKIPFTLPGKDLEFLVSIDMMNAVGQPVRTVIRGVYPSGFHEATWSGADEHGQACAKGLYLCRLVVIQRDRKIAFTERVMLDR